MSTHTFIGYKPLIFCISFTTNPQLLGHVNYFRPPPLLRNSWKFTLAPLHFWETLGNLQMYRLIHLITWFPIFIIFHNFLKKRFNSINEYILNSNLNEISHTKLKFHDGNFKLPLFPFFPLSPSAPFIPPSLYSLFTITRVQSFFPLSFHAHSINKNTTSNE